MVFVGFKNTVRLALVAANIYCFVAPLTAFSGEICAELLSTAAFTYSRDRSDYENIEVSFEGQYAGYIQFYFNPTSRRMGGIAMGVVPGFRDKGVSTLLFKKALEAHPETEVVGGFLEETNFKVFSDHWKGDVSVEQAFHETPAFKTFKKFGFTKTVDLEPTHHHPIGGWLVDEWYVCYLIFELKRE